MRKAISVVLVTFLLLSLYAIAQDQPTGPPKLLVISRNELKVGKMMQYQKLDEQVRRAVANEPKLNWITMTAYAGNNAEESYLMFFNNYAEMEQLDETWMKTAGPLFMSSEFNQAVADTAQSGKTLIAKIRPDLSYNTEKFNMANAKYWSVSYRRLKPGADQVLTSFRKDIHAQLKRANYDGHWLVYQVEYGMPGPSYIVVQDLKSLGDLDMDRTAAYNEAVSPNLQQKFMDMIRENAIMVENVLYQTRPNLSRPSQNLVAANPEFWTVKEQAPAMASAKKGKMKKSPIEPTALKESPK